MKKLSYFLVLFCVVFGVSKTGSVSAQINTYCINGLIHLQTTDKNGAVVTAPYKHKTVAWLKSNNKIIDFSPNNGFMFCGLVNGDYEVEVFLESDLLSPYKEPVPIYKDNFTINNKSSMFMYPTSVVPEKIKKNDNYKD